MSSERSPPCCPPAPPLLPLLIDEVPAALATVLTACTCGSPEQELLALRDRLWLREGTPEPPHISFYRYIEPVLQDGPKCGLVALSMASSCTAYPLPVDRLLREARLRGFTNHGEMFSVDDMATLARDLLHPCREVEVLRAGLDDREYVVRCISQGGVLLVPYDADANHSPCCRRGHKAHWAVVSGILVSQRCCHLVARQGKSRHLAVWPFEDLRLSNLNLFELDPTRAADGRSYVLPVGGVAAGLRGRAVMLHGLGSLCKQWVLKCKRSDLDVVLRKNEPGNFKSRRICSDHFKKEDLRNPNLPSQV